MQMNLLQLLYNHVVCNNYCHCHVVYSIDNDDEWLLNRIWDSEQNWYKTREVIIREEEEKWSFVLRAKDMKLTLLQSSESSLKYTVDMLNKREII